MQSNKPLEMPAPPLGEIAPGAPHVARKRGRSWGKLIGWLVALAVVGLIGYRVMQGGKKEPGDKRPGGGAGQPVPVIVGRVEAKAVPIFLDGLGTVQALQTVTVRARVEGEIQKIAFQEGQEVKAGDLLAQLDAAPFQTAVDQARATLRQNEALLANARRDLARVSELAAKKVMTQQELDTQRTQVARLEASVKNGQAQVASAEVQLGYATITAPISGRTGLRQVDEGNLVQANGTNGIVTITQVQPIALVFTMPEQHLPEIQRAQAGGRPLEVQAVARDNKTVLGKGRLTVIDNQIDTATGTIRLKAEFPNDELLLWPGQFVNAKLLVTTRENGLVVPASVIQRGPEGAFAYVVEEGRAQMRAVEVGHTDAGEALIEQGLRAGEQVVVDGQFRLKPGAEVRVAEGGVRGGGPNPKSAEKPDRSQSQPVPGRRTEPQS